ncbi:MAG: NAD(P)H-dependent oxidoreductase [Oscillospiraceae bacterium]|nr:NAD(P)H-dependent oxidoreductase [Oscillospiraceae bacterium]
MEAKLLVISAGTHRRLGEVLAYALAGIDHETVTPAALPPALAGRRVVFAVSAGAWGLEEDFCRLVRRLRESPDCMEGSSAVVLVDGEGELYTKEAARMLVLAANQAGCAFPGKPLVEGTGSLHNLDVLSRRMGLPQAAVYRETARALVRRLQDFVPPRTARPHVLLLHASDHATSNTLALGGRVRELLAGDCEFEELSLRNGAVHDCRGCSYKVCAHYAQQNSCFYGGSIVDEVYPAMIRADVLMLLCPNYNDSVGANIMAFINRLTSLQLFHSLHDKYLYAIVVSGYSGSDLVAQQVLGALCLNKAFLLPPRFCLLETANDPGSALRAPGIGARLARFAASIRAAAGPADG